MQSVLLLAALVGVCIAVEVKNATAGGYHGSDYPAYDNYYPRYREYLTDGYVCHSNVGYGVYGGRKHNNRRPTDVSCDDVFYNSKNSVDNCVKCCKMTVRLNGFTTEQVHGMVLVENGVRSCVCCAPPVPQPVYAAQPIYPAQPIYQAPPTYPQHTSQDSTYQQPQASKGY